MINCCEEFQPPYYISAYAIAAKHGFIGTEEEWLQSLTGYMHIKYANVVPSRDEHMSDVPGDWMGIYCGRSPQPPEHYTEYVWQYVKGSANAAVIAPAYDRDNYYTTGDVISYGDDIYKCLMYTHGAFDDTAWQRTTLAEAMGAGALHAVSYRVQALTDTEKSIARSNIGAISQATTESIADTAVTAAKLAADSVLTAKIKDGAVTADKMAANAVTAAKIGSGAVTADKIGANAVTAAKIAANAVTAEKIPAAALSGAKLDLTAGDLGNIVLTYGRHYFNANDTLPAASAGKIIFVKAE